MDEKLVTLQYDLEQLKAKKEAALQNGQFEYAASIRDHEKVLMEKIKQHTSDTQNPNNTDHP